MRWMWTQAMEWTIEGNLDGYICLGIIDACIIHGKHLLYLISLNISPLFSPWCVSLRSCCPRTFQSSLQQEKSSCPACFLLGPESSPWAYPAPGHFHALLLPHSRWHRPIILVFLYWIAMQTFVSKHPVSADIPLLVVTVSCPISLSCNLKHLTVVGVNGTQW